MEKILVGKKPAMDYVLNTVSRLSDENELEILARGKNISKAVDVAEILKNRFREDLNKREINIDTDKYTADDGKERKISSISIKLSKNV